MNRSHAAQVPELRLNQFQARFGLLAVDQLQRALESGAHVVQYLGGGEVAEIVAGKRLEGVTPVASVRNAGRETVKAFAH